MGYASTECDINLKLASFTGDCATQSGVASIAIAASNACNNE
jgi:hypothetical protein